MESIELGQRYWLQVAERLLIAGLGTGELFGFHIDEIAILAPIFEPLDGLVGILNVSELTFEQVIKILKVSVAIGIIHMLMAHCSKT